MAFVSGGAPLASDVSAEGQSQLNSHVSVDANQHADQLIKRVHERALAEYRITKKRKQQQLSSKILEAQQCGDRGFLKTQKKKVANHASAFASRVKQEYIVSSFEWLLKEKVTDTFRLSDIVNKQAAIMADKDNQIQQLRDSFVELCQRMNAFSAPGPPAPLEYHPQVPQLEQNAPACQLGDESVPFDAWLQQHPDLVALSTYDPLDQAAKPPHVPCACTNTGCCAQGGMPDGSQHNQLKMSHVSQDEEFMKGDEAKFGAKSVEYLPSRQHTVRYGLLADGLDVSLNPVA